MKKAVSKVRARKARSRQKRAERNAGPVSVREHPALGAAIALLLWAATVGVLAIDLFGHAVTMPTIMPVVADAAFILVGLFTCGLLMQIVKPGLLRDNTRVALLSLIVL